MQARPPSMLALLLAAGCPPQADPESALRAKLEARQAEAATREHRNVPTVHCKVKNFKDDCPEARVSGAWESVVPAEGSAAVYNILGMQTVHTVELPSGHLLLVSGSSWRNRAGIDYYPYVSDPATPNGLFVREEDPFRNEELDAYYELVNNAAIYDPVSNTFYRIPVPVPEADPNDPGHFAPNDLFCTGHQHLRDGNVLFVGGTQYYSPFRTGNNSSYIFDWRAELATSWADRDWRVRPSSNKGSPWTFAGFMKRGRWYASLLPLLDGRQVIFSGYVGFDKGFPDMHVFEINPFVEFFDPDAFEPDDPEAAWRSVDASALQDSPFTTLINPDFEPTPEVDCDARCVESNKYDAFKLYPENYLMPDGRIYLTREGDWVSLRTCDAAFMRRTKYTYWASIGGDRDAPTMSFARGPDRPQDVTSYGTTFRDPETGQIYLLGGQPTSPGTLFPLNSEHPTHRPSTDQPTHFAGGLGSTQLEVFTPDKSAAGGSWSLDPDYLGEEPGDARTMHYTVMLPTGQILVINGGNYDFYGPVYTPVLLTPAHDAKTGRQTGYTQTRLADALEPRLYHNAALLLPDGRVFVSGGNSARATVTPSTEPPEPYTGKGQPKPDLSQVETDVYFHDDGPMARALPGQAVSPTEDWTAEIFSPPYLFIDPGRRARVTSIAPTQDVTFTASADIGGKTFSLLHSEVSYHVGLEDLPTCEAGEHAQLALIKLPSATHGWQNGQEYFALSFQDAGGGLDFTAPNAMTTMIPPAYYMLFYTDCKGKPAEAWMVRFDDEATAP